LIHKVITLITDFGMNDSFVAQMKGVLLTINPACTIIDITHEIDPFNIKKAALSLGFAYRYFPAGSIHVAVVDPGVGSVRKGIIVSADGHYFIGPDNGIFSYIYHNCGNGFKVYHLNNDMAYELPQAVYLSNDKGNTFHGRDVFAPVAARLSIGQDIDKFGSLIGDFVQFSIPKPKIIDGVFNGEILYIDHPTSEYKRFGNAITNINKDILQEIGLNATFNREVQQNKKRLQLVFFYSNNYCPNIFWVCY